MLIDPSIDNCNQVKQALTPVFNLTCVNTLDNAKSIIESNQPDLLLLEINQKNSTSYDFCAELQKSINTRFIPIIFISDEQTVEDRLNAYISGGDDFLQKPFEVMEIIAKINANLKRAMDQRILESKLSVSEADSDDKSNAIHEQNILISFLQAMSIQKNPHDIILLLIATFEKFHLQVCVEINFQETILREKHNSEPFSLLEEKIFDHLKNRTQHYYFKNKFFICYQDIHVLVNNMPISDNNIYTRYISYIMTMVKTVHQCFITHTFSNNSTIAIPAIGNSSTDNTTKLDIKSFYAKLNHIDTQFRFHQVKSVEVIEELLSSIEDDTKGLMLDESQENKISEIIKEGMKKSLSLYDNGIKLDLQVGEILDQLERALK